MTGRSKNASSSRNQASTRQSGDPAGSQRVLRCAVYTRVSTDAGLEQEFNSLDAQREACEAYIKSQTHEGWRLIPGHFDDGGFSGGSMDRPALQSLVEAVRARRIDTIVVYKVDRLTRSLADFAKLVELFDEHGVSFVSVTQAFNTTTSMGRLTLNVLLSFAQFEREVTGERIRDKIAASKKKGIWMGGVVPLGYRVEARALHVVEEHAAIIKTLFHKYLALGSVVLLKRELDAEHIQLPLRMDGKGNTSGGGMYSRGHLYKLLSNPIYIGKLAHKGQVHDGQHAAIIDQELFDQVQAKLARQTRAAHERHSPSNALLLGKIRDDRGNPMSPAHANKNGRRYRYYVSQALLQGKRDEAGSIARVPAMEIETLVLKALRDNIGKLDASPSGDERDLVESVVGEVRVGLTSVVITLARRDNDSEATQTPADPSLDRIRIAWTLPSSRRHREIIVPGNHDPSLTRALRANARTRVLEAIARARCWLAELSKGAIVDTESLATREGKSERSIRQTLSLAFLSPVIIKAAIEGRLPRGLGLSRLIDLPMDWIEQHRALGLPTSGAI